MSLDKVLAFIKDNPDISTSEIATGTGIPKRTVQRVIRKLLDSQQIRVSRYEKTAPKSKRKERAFSADGGKSVIFRRMPKIMKHQAKLEWQRRRREREKVIQTASQYGVFGVAAAQIISNRKKQ